jgi:hypothetical protein
LYNVDKQLNDENPMNEKMLALAAWLEDAENDILKDCDDAALEVVATALVNAAESIRDGAEVFNVEKISLITEKSLEEMAAIAEAFDASGDELLMKQASVLDEILMTISSSGDAIFNYKKAESDRIDELKKKYEDVKKKLDEMGKIKEAGKEIEKSNVYKEYRTLEAPLKNRYCPDHAGAQISRVSENDWQCAMDGKIYNYETGFTLLNGDKVPGGDVSGQSHLQQHMTDHQVFDEDTRENRMKNHQ